ncbi:hypothetical protein SDC9_179590 [bioreactor metagenome]|uniref:Uncharacterized protein n=1 Tax=bioreactor metagenome TaxID=1076179 RepID=A0A645H756_9ZZZZ
MQTQARGLDPDMGFQQGQNVPDVLAQIAEIVENRQDLPAQLAIFFSSLALGDVGVRTAIAAHSSIRVQQGHPVGG